MKNPLFIVTEQPIGPGKVKVHGPANYDWACWLAVSINLEGKASATVSKAPKVKKDSKT